jgi:hypothetical protein
VLLSNRMPESVIVVCPVIFSTSRPAPSPTQGVKRWAGKK